MHKPATRTLGSLAANDVGKDIKLAAGTRFRIERIEHFANPTTGHRYTVLTPEGAMIGQLHSSNSHVHVSPSVGADGIEDDDEGWE